MRTFLTSIIFIALASLSAFATQSTADSLAIENQGGKSFIVHKVSDGETLYSLLKRYRCTVEDVLAANPSLKGSTTIFLNQVVKFPVTSLEKNEEKVILLGKDGKFKEINENSKVVPQLHQVAEGETLYSIGRKYGMDAQKIKELNALDNNAISVGQKLIVSPDYQPIGPAGDETIPSKKTITKKTTAVPDYVPNAPRGKRMSENGIATVINAGKASSKQLVLHRFAPIGSYLKVTNEGNGQSILVKVLGRLPDTGINQDVLIRLSPSAFEKLQPRDSRIRVSISYELAPN